jgi:pimeloyl-ACP methyl ester carboxylesterase
MDRPMSDHDRGYVRTASGLIHWRQVGGAEPPIVLLHRTPVCSASFDRVLARLAGRRRAIALDTPGFGQSFRPEGSPSTVTYAQWLLGALDGLGVDAFHLLGHHTGTHFATEMAKMAPNRVLSLTLSGVLYADAPTRATFREGIGQAPPVDADGAYLSATWSTIKGLFSAFDPALVHTEVLGALACPEGRNQAFDAILSQDFAAVLRAVRAPVRILQAEDDALGFCLDAVRRAHPEIPITLHGPAGMAAPELQPGAIAEFLLRLDQTL